MSVDEIFDEVIADCESRIKWYSDGAGKRKQVAKGIRFTAIVSVGIAGIIPMVSAVLPDVHSALASIALGIAAILISLDRFFGHSSAWIRYRTSEQELQRRRDLFRMQWVALRAEQGDRPLTPEETDRMITLCAEFLSEIWAVVQEETRAWADEFKSALDKLDQEISTRADSVRTGALRLEVENGPDAEDGWTLTIDGRDRGRQQGATAVVTGLFPRSHVIVATGTIGGRAARAEGLATVAPAGVADVKLKLA